MRQNLFLASCAVAVALSGAARAEECSGRASAPWTQAGKGYSVDAIADGPDCAKAVVVLVVRGPDGKALHTFLGTSDTIISFGDTKTKAAMKATLARWLVEANTMPTSDQLPDWKDKQEQPGSGQFPFYPEYGVKRTDYLAIRKAKRPVFCYAQGMESVACVVLDADGVVTKVGAQAIPG